ncbi:MAG: hypothetical protein HC880_03375 [Bacteroidia bacterium]|nr:hypothetical protein [Bacteroidia bacterium]
MTASDIFLEFNFNLIRTMNPENSSNLFTEFDPSTTQEWVDEIVKTLKGQGIQSLTTATYEGIDLLPFYAPEDATEPFLSPNDFSKPQHWQNREIIRVEEQDSAQVLAQEAQSFGADFLHFDLRPAKDVNISRLLDRVDITTCPLGFIVRQPLSDLLPQLSHYPSVATVDYDFLGDWTRHGQISEDHWQDMHALLNWADQREHCRVVVVNGGHFHHAGANVVQELAFSTALAVNYLDKLSDMGFSPAQIMAKMEFSLWVGSHYFLEIAKFRAMRLIWKQIQQQFQVSENPIFIHARNSLVNKTLSDPYNNMLRATTEAMSAVVGGSDALTIDPYDVLFSKTDSFSRRIARNVSAILREEAHLDKVTDPSAGAYYLEELTSQLAERAWNLFREVESQGGFISAFQQGFIQNEIEQVTELKRQQVREGKNVIVGTNQFQNKAETVNFPASEPNTPLQSGLRLLHPFRLAEDVERERFAR